jgi:hypothetical protein
LEKYTLIISNEDGYNINIASDDFESLKRVAIDYNKEGMNVQITKTSVVYKVMQDENKN